MESGIPISPDQVANIKQKTIPKEVIDAFNELIEKNFIRGSATILQEDVVKLIVEKLNLDNDNVVYENGWLNVEPLYESAGWKVVYDKPGYCDDYKAVFYLSKR